jgi:hypothetical protein
MSDTYKDQPEYVNPGLVNDLVVREYAAEHATSLHQCEDCHRWMSISEGFVPLTCAVCYAYAEGHWAA